ncbi:MAG: ABC transporter permease [Rhodothermales bacterium]|nr:ABC transporter permease [Rhodothermales bacterium]
MRAFRGFIIKEFLHIFRDRRTLVILFGMPVIQLMLFGFAIRNEVEDVRIAVVDWAQDPVSEALIDRIDASPYLRVVPGIRHGQIEQAFRRGEVKVAVVIPRNLARDLAVSAGSVSLAGAAPDDIQVAARAGPPPALQVITDATDPNTASTVLAYLTAVVGSYQLELVQGSGGSLNAGIGMESRMRFNPELRSVVLFVPGLVALILMLVCALMTSITITREKEIGTMEILLVSPLRPGLIIIGKVMPYLALSLVNVITILILASQVFGVPIRGSLTLLLAECFLFILCALGLGIFISTRTSSQQVAMMVSLAGLLLPTVILSGFIFPIESMPDPLQVVSHIVPAKWFLRIIRGIMIKGVGLEAIWQETLILVGMTTVFLAASVKGFNVRLSG